MGVVDAVFPDLVGVVAPPSPKPDGATRPRTSRSKKIFVLQKNLRFCPKIFWGTARGGIRHDEV